MYGPLARARRRGYASAMLQPLTREERKARREQRFVNFPSHRSWLIGRNKFVPNTSFRRAFDWLVPWSRHTFPGLGRVLDRVFEGRAGRTTVWNWQAGKHHPPRWAVELLADQIEARCRAGLDLVAQLRAMPPRKRPGPSGFVVVKDATDRRQARTRDQARQQGDKATRSLSDTAAPLEATSARLCVPIIEEHAPIAGEREV